jgi:hypothetical protein
LPRLALVAILPLLAGCFYSVLESPRVLAPGSIALGSVVGLADEYPQLQNVQIHEFGAQVSAGLLPGMDASLRLSSPANLYGSARYQLLTHPCLLAVGVGLSVWPLLQSSLWREHPTEVGVYPSLVAGTDRVYYGLRAGLLRTGPLFGRDAPSYAIQPQALIGFIFGTRLQVIPEAFIVAKPGNGSVALVGGIGVGVRYIVGPIESQSEF